MIIIKLLEKIALGKVEDGTVFKASNDYYSDLIYTENTLMVFYDYNDYKTLTARDIIELIEDDVLYE